MQDYFTALFHEIEAKGAQYPRVVDNVYIGGGTPSLAQSYLPTLAEKVRKAFCVREDAEFSVECNPESVTPAFLSAARSAGVNRVSVGVHSLSNNLLKRIGRAHDRACALKALELLTSVFPSI